MDIPLLPLLLVFLFLTLCVFLVYTEIKSQDCLPGYGCLNATPIPEKEDTSQEIIDKIITTLRVNHTSVEWRKALLIGLVVAFLIIFLYSCPTLQVYTLLTLIIFLWAYFAFTWTIWTSWRYHDTYIERGLLILRSRSFGSSK